jgi:exopolysaccharide production protein ExoZ
VRPQGVPAIVTAGSSALLCVVGGMGLERAHWPEIRWLKHIGDASYSIFLWHIPAIVGMTLVLGRVGVQDGLACVAATIPACIVVGLVLYQALERPMTQWLFGAIDRRAMPQAPMRQASV